MPTDTKNSTANASRHRQRLRCGSQAVGGSPDHHPGEKGPECHRHAEDQGRTDGDAERDDQHGQREELARTCRGDVVQQARDHPCADDGGKGDEGGHFHRRQPEGHPQRHGSRRRAEQRGQEHQRHDREQVFDDEPSDAMWPACV